MCYNPQDVVYLQSQKEKTQTDAWISKKATFARWPPSARAPKNKKKAPVGRLKRGEIHSFVMLLKPSRLPSQEFRSGWRQTVATPYFLLKTKENHKARNRIGIVVGTAANKNAVKRNFLKRQARAVFQTVHDAGAGKDFLLVVSSKTSSLKKKQFRTLLLETIGKSKDIKK